MKKYLSREFGIDSNTVAELKEEFEGQIYLDESIIKDSVEKIINLDKIIYNIDNDNNDILMIDIVNDRLEIQYDGTEEETIEQIENEIDKLDRFLASNDIYSELVIEYSR